MRVDGVPTRVIGVTPRKFHGLYQGAEIEGRGTLWSYNGCCGEVSRHAD